MIKLYSIGCPKCKVLESKLQQMGVDFELIDNEEEVLKFAEEHGLSTAPIMVADDEIMDFTEAIRFLRG